jgi:ATP-dependent DNA helicase DinG
MKTMERQLPFPYNLSQSFFERLHEWVGDVFYDTLPEAGFELRDEQIYMAYQLERAFADKKVIFSEAGVGTGKTIVYLLYAICYARYMRKPAIIACADESLIEQLVKPEGDIAKLSKHLQLNIDVRLAKSLDQYLCLKKLDEERRMDATGVLESIHAELPEFVNSNKGIQAFYPYGDRKNYPHLNNETWNMVGWDKFQDCLVCDKRHRCGQTLSREHYRQATDLIICSHDFYMEHIWTYEGRKREGQLPLLPEPSAIVFDEGHLLEMAAQEALTYKLRHLVLDEILSRLLPNGARESLAVLIGEIIWQSERFFERLGKQTLAVPGSNRKEIEFTDGLRSEADALMELLTLLEEEMAIESGLHTVDDYNLRIVDEHIEMIQIALGLFRKTERLISWVTEDAEGLTLHIMPRLVKEVLHENVFSKPVPIVFSSATLSVEGSFHYLADSLGINNYLSFSVPSPFDYANQMKLYAPRLKAQDATKAFAEKFAWAAASIAHTEGRALLLFNNDEDLQLFKIQINEHALRNQMNFLFEGDQEISHLISAFQTEENSVLCAISLWEGLDIPGPSLSNVVIWSLPFPPNDPVFTAKRRASADPFWEVDIPYMILRLKQGIGRLIRTREDRGIAAILSEALYSDEKLLETIKAILPAGVELSEGPVYEMI